MIGGLGVLRPHARLDKIPLVPSIKKMATRVRFALTKRA
ncbi:hypothetical protein [Caudoviricetes sp.]|nr:hypothetical protein [Caudoviricetes sp.]